MEGRLTQSLQIQGIAPPAREIWENRVGIRSQKIFQVFKKEPLGPSAMLLEVELLCFSACLPWSSSGSSSSEVQSPQANHPD